MMLQNATVPDADSIRETAREVMSGEEFDLSGLETQESYAGRLQQFLDWVWGLLVSFSELLEGWPAPLRWLLYIVLTALLVLLVWHIVFTMSRGLRVRAPSPRAARAGRVPDPRDLERLAEEAFEREDYVESVRLLFRSAILRLESAERRAHRPGLTNRELLRRYRSTPIHSALRQFVDVLDTTWYGGHECRLVDYEACRKAHTVVSERARQARAAATRSSPAGHASE